MFTSVVLEREGGQIVCIESKARDTVTAEDFNDLAALRIWSGTSSTGVALPRLVITSKTGYLNLRCPFGRRAEEPTIRTHSRKRNMIHGIGIEDIAVAVAVLVVREAKRVGR
jgi:hypothetical protein